MNWYKTAQEPNETPDLIERNLVTFRLQELRKDMDQKYEKIYQGLQTDKAIDADPYDNLARLKTLNAADKLIGQYFQEFGWEPRVI
ncbi:unnamed protein product [marine sediment metagenome]|uniref:Uncharacterized protein n=1 Tax=marine sediment metagenome TaxID=412755 RepID=X1D434_9ZZZZ